MTDRINAILTNDTYRSLLDMLSLKETDRIYCRHGLDHLISVARIAYIMSLETGADIPKDYIYAAALLHDIGRAAPENTGRKHHELSVELAEGILRECGFDGSEIAQICDAIGSHNTDGETRSGLAYYLYRADKLERSCYDCDAADSCYWPDMKKNRGVIY